MVTIIIKFAIAAKELLDKKNGKKLEIRAKKSIDRDKDL